MTNQAGGGIVIKDLYTLDSSRKVENVLNSISLYVTGDMLALIMQRRNQATSLGELLYRAISRDPGCKTSRSARTAHLFRVPCKPREESL